MLARVNIGIEDTAILVVDSVVYIAVSVVGKMDNRVPAYNFIGESPGPGVAGVGHVWTSVLGHLVAKRGRIHRGESKSDGAAPALGDLEHLDVDALVGQDDPIAEYEGLTEALGAAGDEFVLVELRVRSVNMVELDRRQVVLGCNEQRLGYP